MKRIFYILLLFENFFFFQVNGQAPNWIWAKDIGGGDWEESHGVTTDLSGNVYLTGFFKTPTVAFGTVTLTYGGGRDFFIAKYDPSGNVLWAKNQKGISDDEAYDVKTDASGNVYVCGEFRNTMPFPTTTLTASGTADIFIAKYSTNGNVLWAKSFGGPSQQRAYGLAIDPGGNVFMAGEFASSSIAFGTYTLNCTSGFYDMFVTKIDPNGNILWATNGSGSDNDYALSISTDISGNAYVTGAFNSPTLTLGSSTLISQGLGDVFIAKIDGNGSFLWAKEYGGTGSDNAQEICTDGSGNSYMIGSYYSPMISFGTYTLTNSSPGSSDIFVVKHDINGNILWTNNIGGTGLDNGNSITCDALGNTYLTGYFSNSLSIGTTSLSSVAFEDLLIAKIDFNGNFIWAKSAGGNNNDWGSGIALDASGDIYLTGSNYSDSISVGSINLLNGGTVDLFITKLSVITGLKEYYFNETFNIYPNPTTGSVNLILNSDVEISIYNLLGEKIFTRSLKRGLNSLDLSFLNSGVYFLYERDSKTKIIKTQ